MHTEGKDIVLNLAGDMNMRVLPPAPGCVLTDEEYESLAALHSQQPSNTTTAEELRESDRLADERLARRVLALDSDGKLVGAAVLRSWHSNPPDHMGIDVRVDVTRRGNGWGSALLETVEQLAREAGARLLTISALDSEGGAGFAEKRGYAETWRALESFLELRDWKQEQSKHLLPSSVRVLPYSKLTDSVELRRKLYAEVSVLTEPDVPGAAIGHVWSFEDFQAQIFDRPCARADQVYVAAAGTTWIGMASVSEPRKGKWVNDFTGVVPAWRGKGIARALKLAVVSAALKEGASEIRTFNDSTNAPMLAVNRALGYQIVKTWVRLDRRLESKER